MAENEKGFDFQTMAVVLYCMLKSGTNLGPKHYQMMSEIDGSRGPSAFEHQFRKVKARARELQEQVESGQLGQTPTSKKAKGANGIKATSAKRSRSTLTTDELADDDTKDFSPEASPSRKKAKVKTEEARVKTEEV